MTITEKTQKIKQFAKKIGFDDIGIVKAIFLEEEKERLLSWLENNYHANMGYMERNVEKRLDPRLLVENAKSVIVLLRNYYPEKKQQHKDSYKISKYAYGQDYHNVIKKYLWQLYDYINTEIEPITGRVFVDSAPIMERTWAKRAGLGWIGKNSLLITKRGSFFFISELIIDLELDYENVSYREYCGKCTRCVDACPTNAIVKPYVVDAVKCISYQTIENKGELDKNLTGMFDDWIYGCDICQDVCPWNRYAKESDVDEFKITSLLNEMNKEDWENISKTTFDNIFRKSAVKRTKYSGLVRNINFVNKKENENDKNEENDEN